MSRPVIITVAITGSVPRKKDNPAVPVTPAEQVESTHEAFEAGATIAHIHVRDENEVPSSDPERFAAVQEGIRKHCPGMIVQFSTGGRGRDHTARGAALYLEPDMGSLSTGSVNFPNMIYENPPDLIDALAKEMVERKIKPEIEIFDAAMLYNAIDLMKRGLLAERPHMQFVMGLRGALPARKQVLEFLVKEYRELVPDGTWTAAGLGKSQLTINHWALELGGHCRTGLEDNIKFDRNRLAKSNAELVGRVADLTAEYGGHPASAAEARELLGL